MISASDLSVIDKLFDRHAMLQLEQAVSDTRIVLVQGARQVGKSTLVAHFAAARPHVEIRSLDDPPVLESARADPVEFVRTDGTLVIDDIQRAPELILPIKAAVDRSRRPGQYVLTGSAGILAMSDVPDALPGPGRPTDRDLRRWRTRPPDLTLLF